MTPRAQEVAEKIAKVIKSLLNFTVISRQDSENMSAVVQEIAAELEKYGEESVREAVIESFGPEYQKIRAEAIDECAKIVEAKANYDWGTLKGQPFMLNNIAEEIRALRDKK